MNAWRREGGYGLIDLTKTNLSGFDFSKFDLLGANLSGSNLSHANFSNAVLFWTNLTGADLRGATLKEADFSRSDLTGADLRGAIDLTETKFADARITTTTKYDSGVTLNGARYFEDAAAPTIQTSIERFSATNPREVLQIAASQIEMIDSIALRPAAAANEA